MQPSSPRNLSKRNENICLYKDLYTDVHNNICTSQRLKTTQKSINRGRDKQTVVYPHNSILFSNNSIIDTCNVLIIGLLTHAMINLKIIMLNERSQMKKSTYCMIPFINKLLKILANSEARNQISGCLGIRMCL